VTEKGRIWTVIIIGLLLFWGLLIAAAVTDNAAASCLQNSNQSAETCEFYAH